MEREQASKLELTHPAFALHGWIGLGLVAAFWAINWAWTGLRTYWAFFPLWVGYCLVVDALVLWRTGSSLLTRSRRQYVGLFLLSAPIWWAFEALNARTLNWVYMGIDGFSVPAYVFWTTLSFSTVVPAVFGAAELAASTGSIKRLGRGPRILPDRPTTIAFFITGWLMVGLLLAWPRVFFPFIWLAGYFIIEPVNIWLGYRSLADWTARGDWRPVISLWLGVLLTAFFWEMWNYFSYPKWVYHVAWGDWLHVFEMPLLGYGGYLPFALELYAFYHLIMGLLGQPRTEYVRVHPEETGHPESTR
jgi:hypothetical protein